MNVNPTVFVGTVLLSASEVISNVLLGEVRTEKEKELMGQRYNYNTGIV